MSQQIQIRLQLGPFSQEYPIKCNTSDGEVRVQIRSIFRIINNFIVHNNYVIVNYLNIWVLTPNGRENLFALKKHNSMLRIGLGQSGRYQLGIRLEQMQQKHNVLRNFYKNTDQYNRLSSNINKIIEQSKQQQKKRGEKNMRPIDIAYFFADPLVQVGRNGIRAKHEVSYQLEYDKFIDLVKREEFGNNFRIEMMVATKTNIKNTLFDGASILHFACHGKQKVGNLQIQSDTSVGQLVDLQHSQFLSLLDVKIALPKLIIFNVCFSNHLAKLVSEKKKIITIGYYQQANDEVCQEFTRQFYMGLFKHREKVRELFTRIKEEITIKYPKQGKKLVIYPQQPFQEQQQAQFFASNQSRLNFVKKWTPSQSMRQNDSLGVKGEIFTFIKQHLTNGQRISFLFLKGERRSGKTDFLRKTRIYLMNRKVFTDDFSLDLRSQQQGSIQTILQLRLQKQQFITKKMTQLRQLARERRTNPLIIIDHADRLIRLQYSQFIDYLHNKILKDLRYGKVVIATNNIRPLVEEDAQRFSKALTHLKLPPRIQPLELTNYISRYKSDDISTPAVKIYKNKLCSDLKLAIALKHSRSASQLTQMCEKQSSQNDRSQQDTQISNFQRVSLQFMDIKCKQVQKMLDNIQDCLTIKIQQNDYIFLSTIFSDIQLQRDQHYTSSSCSRKEEKSLHCIGEEFNRFFREILRGLLKEKKLEDMKSKIPLSQFFKISLKIGGLLYMKKQLQYFQKHLLDCQRSYVLVTALYRQQLRKNSTLLSLVNQYHLKFLLALYSFYSQSKFSERNKAIVSAQASQTASAYGKKAIIIDQQLMLHFDKKQTQGIARALKQLFSLDIKAQQYHYDPAYHFNAQGEGRQRRQSEYFDLSGGDEFDGSEQTVSIERHDDIMEYWKTARQLERTVFHHQVGLTYQSMILLQLLIIKAIFCNLRLLQIILKRGQNYLSEKASTYVIEYLPILQKIHSDGIFSDRAQGLFKNICEAMKPLYSKYLKAFIETYFMINRINQQLNKQYNLHPFYEMIQICEWAQTTSGIASLRKMIQMHVQQQFFNSWTCTALVSLPLYYERGHSKHKYNIKRYQSQLYSFASKFYKKIDKQVRFQMKGIDEIIPQDQQNSIRTLIQLVICDCKEDRHGIKVYLQTQTGKSKPVYLQQFVLPKAPVVIYFGMNVNLFEYVHRDTDSIVIRFNIKSSFRELQNSLQKQKHLGSAEDYTKMLDIYYIVLEHFYCSFCRHFFNGSHTLLVDQARTSYDLARAQALIKAKIHFNKTSSGFRFQKEINEIIEQIDCNLPFIINSQLGGQFKKKPAFHFACKQRLERAQIQQWGMRYQQKHELGGNIQIAQLLIELQKQIDHQSNFLIIYYSRQMLDSFLKTLWIKLHKRNNRINPTSQKPLQSKQNKFKLYPQITPKNYKEYRENQNKRLKVSSFHQLHQQGSELSIRPFIDIQENQIKQEIISVVFGRSFVKLFFCKNKTVQIDKTLFQKVFWIMESYQQNKAQYDIYYSHLKLSKPNIPQKKFNSFYKQNFRSTAKLQDIRTAIQKLEK